MNILEKLITVVISALLFSVGFSLLNNTMVYFGVYLLFSIVLFLVGGVLFSVLADRMLAKINFNKQITKYLISVALYAVGGIIVNVLLYIVIFNEGFGADALYMMLYGIVAALIYLHVMIIIRKVLKAAK